MELWRATGLARKTASSAGPGTPSGSAFGPPPAPTSRSRRPLDTHHIGANGARSVGRSRSARCHPFTWMGSWRRIGADLDPPLDRSFDRFEMRIALRTSVSATRERLPTDHPEEPRTSRLIARGLPHARIGQPYPDTRLAYETRGRSRTRQRLTSGSEEGAPGDRSPLHLVPRLEHEIPALFPAKRWILGAGRPSGRKTAA